MVVNVLTFFNMADFQKSAIVVIFNYTNLKTMITKQELENAIGQRVMDYSVEDGRIYFSIRLEEYGYDTDPGFFADFGIDEDGTLFWIPDIPTESLVAPNKVKTASDVDHELSDYGDWEPDWDEDDED